MTEGYKSNDIQKAVELTAKMINSEIAEIHGPLWNFRVEYAKLLISLCSVILVGTITFSSSLFNPKSGIVYASWLLVVSWSLILLSLLFGLRCVWLHFRFLSFYPRFFYLIPDLVKNIENHDKNSESFKNDLKNIVESKVLDPMGKADKQAFLMINTSFVCFSFGLATFIVFGALQII